jgi:uncharacterized protein YkwD
MRFLVEEPMKKVFFAAFFVLVFFVSCSNNNKDDIYGGFEDEDDYSEVPDRDHEGYERPDDAPMPGGSGGNESGDPSGSTGSKDDDNAGPDEDSEPENDDENGNDGGNNEIPDGDSDSDGEKPDENDVEEGVYALEPDVASCTSGIPSDSEKKKVLDRINYLRSIHKLSPVVYDEKDDEIAAECALVIAANEQLSHTPDSSWECWSQVAYDGCHSSNIHIEMASYDISSTNSADIVDGFMTEEYQGEPKTLGHRRWLIDPWLTHIAFGRADYYDGSGYYVIGSAIKVINDDDGNDDISTDIKFVAYPFENYPKELYNDNIMMSFTVIKDKFSKYSNGTGINFASATIAIIDPDNKTMKVKNIESDTQGYGVPNNLRWYVEGIKPNVKYNVTVSDIMINNNPEFYQYWFELK